MLKLLIFFTLIPLAAHATNNIEIMQAIVDAQEKYSAYTNFMSHSSQAEREQVIRTKRNTDLDTFYKREVSSEVNYEDVYYCKVGYEINKLRNQPINIFRKRTKSESEDVGRADIKQSCLDHLEIYAKNKLNKDFLCSNIAYKSAVCINAKRPEKRLIRRWMRSY